MNLHTNSHTLVSITGSARKGKGVFALYGIKGRRGSDQFSKLLFESGYKFRVPLGVIVSVEDGVTRKSNTTRNFPCKVQMFYQFVCLFCCCCAFCCCCCCCFCWFFFFFFCVPQLYFWGSPLLGEIFAYVTFFFFNPTIKVVTFRLRGWCVLGVFLLPAFTRLGHERQDLLSPCDEMHVCTD